MGLFALSFSIFATTASAGGQLEQPSEVNSSTTAKPLLAVIVTGIFFLFIKEVNTTTAIASHPGTTYFAEIIFSFFIKYDIYLPLVGSGLEILQ